MPIEIIEHRTLPIDRVIPHPGNPRTHPPAQITQLRASYREFGQFRSLVGIETASTGPFVWCVAGSGTLQAMKEESAATVDIGFLPSSTPPDVVEAIMAADNLLPRGGVDDQALLHSILKSQAKTGRNLAALGLGKPEADRLLAQLLAESKTAFLAPVVAPPAWVGQLAVQHDLLRTLPEQRAEQGALIADPGEQWVTMNFTLTQEQREVILAACRRGKAQWSVNTQAEALAQICQHYVNGGQ